MFSGFWVSVKKRKDIRKGGNGEWSFVGSALSKVMFVAVKWLVEKFFTVCDFGSSFWSGDKDSIKGAWLSSLDED